MPRHDKRHHRKLGIDYESYRPLVPRNLFRRELRCTKFRPDAPRVQKIEIKRAKCGEESVENKHLGPKTSNLTLIQGSDPRVEEHLQRSRNGHEDRDGGENQS